MEKPLTESFLLVEKFLLAFIGVLKSEAELWKVGMPATNTYKLSQYTPSDADFFTFKWAISHHNFSFLELTTTDHVSLFKHEKAFLKLAKEHKVSVATNVSWTWQTEEIDHPLATKGLLTHPKPLYTLRIATGKGIDDYFSYIPRSYHPLAHISGLTWVEYMTKGVGDGGVQSTPYGMYFSVWSKKNVENIIKSYDDPEIKVVHGIKSRRGKNVNYFVEIHFKDVPTFKEQAA